MLDDEKSRIFIDADAFVALIDQNDANHSQALLINPIIKKMNYSSFTSNFAVGEAITVLSQNKGHSHAVAFGKKMFSNKITIIDATRPHQLKALQKFAQATSKNVRFADYINMVMMEELAITTIFSFDKHYKREGCKRLGVDSKPKI